MITSLTREDPLKKFLLSSLASLLVMLALPVAGAFAASATSQGLKNYCVEQISPLRAGQLSSDVVSTDCFATLSQSVAFSTNGAIHLSPAATPRDLIGAMMRNISFRPFTTTTIAYLYENGNYNAGGGGMLTITTSISNPVCNSSYDYGLSTMPSQWDNQVSSFAVVANPPGAGCVYTRLYEGASYTGTNACFNGNTDLTVDPNKAYNDTASSFRWSLTNPC